MEKILYPSPYMNITQGFKEGTHKACFALDDAGSDGGIDFIVAPFTGTIKKIYTSDANEVWLESNEPVLFADGTVDYATMMIAHDNDVSNLYVGQVIKQNGRFYEEGTKGYATGNHVHFEIAKGKFEGTGWHEDEAGYWSLNNGVNPLDCFMINDDHVILNSYGYKFKHISEVNEPVTGLKYLNLEPFYNNEPIDSWRVYDLDVEPIVGNEKAKINPAQFGGLSYLIKELKENIAIIETDMFGISQIYINHPACSITDSPKFEHGKY